MKSKSKIIWNRLKKFIQDNLLVILSSILLLLIVILIALSSIIYKHSKDSNATETVYLCSMTTDNNDAEFNSTYSDFICLSAPILKLDTTSYRCVGSIFLGYEGSDCYLYYPVAYTDSNNIRSYKYQRQLCEYNILYNISIAVQNIQSSSIPINVDFGFSIQRGKHYSTLLRQDIYETEFYDFHCFIDEINPLDNNLNGYTTFSEYYCYAGTGDYRYKLRLYKLGNLSNEPNNYNITDRYNPCLHFNDYSGYSNGYDIGREQGEQVGFDRGYSEGVISEGLFGFLSTSVTNLLEVEIFPQFSIGDALWIGVGIVLFGVFMKIFRF